MYEQHQDTGTPGPQNRIRARLARDRLLVGSWVMLRDTLAIEKILAAGVDFVAIDCQHGSNDLGSIIPLLQIADRFDTGVLVRVPASDPWMIGRALDLGASGVIVPLVNSASQAAEAVAATRYPPRGNRSFGPVRSVPGNPFADDDGPLLLAMIETTQGLESVTAIARTPGVDGLFVGPVDLALGIGAGAPADVFAGNLPPTLTGAIDQIAAAAADAGILFSGAVFGEPHARSAARDGMRLIVHGTDGGWLSKGAQTTAALATELRSTIVTPHRKADQK